MNSFVCNFEVVENKQCWSKAYCNKAVAVLL